MVKSLRDTLEQRHQELIQEKGTWDPTIKDIVANLCPYRARWTNTAQRGHGKRKDQSIYNSTPLQDLEILSSGMMAGVTSPARKWFGFATNNPNVSKQRSVRIYLNQAQGIAESVLQASNLYTVLADSIYPDLGSIATSAMLMEEAGLGKIVFTPLVQGEYWLDIDQNGKVDTCFRRIPMTVRQIVQKFGFEATSPLVQRLYTEGNLGKVFQVIQAIVPNSDFREGGFGYEGMRWSSCWWERTDPRKNTFLRKSGYHEFPVLAPRWTAADGDVYGRGPGWKVLGDCKGLQHKEHQLAKMLDKLVDPPMKGSGIKRASLLPGDLVEVARGKEGLYEPALTIPPAAIEKLEQHIMRDEERVHRGLFRNLWQALLNDNRRDRPTATEVEALRQEIMLQLGPLLERLNADLLGPMIERLLAILDRQGLLPPPPPELLHSGDKVKVQFISVLHQMQQAVGLLGIRTLLQEAQIIAQMKPEVLDKMDVDALMDELARITGINPELILSNDMVAKVRALRAKQEQAQQEGAAGVAAAQGLQAASGADPAKLQALAQMMSPAAAAQGGAG